MQMSKFLTSWMLQFVASILPSVFFIFEVTDIFSFFSVERACYHISWCKGYNFLESRTCFSCYTHVIIFVVLDLIILYRIFEYHFNRLNVVKRYRFSRPQPGCHYNQTLPGRESLNYSRPGRTWLVTSRLKTGKTITFNYVFYSAAMNDREYSICRERNGVHGRAETGSRPFLGYRSAAERPARLWRPLPAARGRIRGEHPRKSRTQRQPWTMVRMPA